MKPHRLAFILVWGLLGLTGSAQTVDTVVTNELFEPYGVTVDSGNSYYIADSANHRIAKYDPDTGFLTTLAGQVGQSGYTDGPGFIARFNSPRGVVFARGGIVVADSGNNMIRFVTITGRVATVQTLAGSLVAGKTDGPANSAALNFPTGLAIDKNGDIYIADFKNQSIRKLDGSNIVSTVASGFLRPTAVALDNNGRIYVADSGNNTIQVIDNGVVSLLAGSAQGVSGSHDDYFATNALFNAPSGILWGGNSLGLLVSDTGNHTLRRVFVDPDLSAFFGTAVWSATTYAGKAGQPGLVNGLLADARFNGPVGLSRDYDNGLLVVDGDNRALRRIQISPARPPVMDPIIGYVTYVFDSVTGAYLSELNPIEDVVFYNDVVIAVLSEPHTVTFTVGPTPQIDEADTVPTPIPGVVGESSLPYEDGWHPDQVPPSMVSPQPDITIKAIATSPPRKPSALVKARLQFRTAPPVVIGDNPALFTVLCETIGSQIFYTIDDSVILTNKSTQPGIFGPLVSGDNVTLKITNNVTFRAQAFRDYFQPSLPITKQLSPTNFDANRLTFGFENGEASSRFIAAAGQTFFAPVTLSLLLEQKIFSMQFAVIITNLTGPPIAPGAYDFESMLMKPVTQGGGTVYYPIPPAMFVATNDSGLGGLDLPDGFPPALFEWGDGVVFASLLLRNTNNNLLMVGWLERVTKTNLYNTLAQDLVTYSIAHDRLWESSQGKVVVGGYAFRVPANAAFEQEYSIELIRASATSDGISADVYIETPTNGSSSVGAINAFKKVKVGYPRYLVGDVAPFRWFNAGDFGEGWLLNNDVLQVFQSLLYVGTNFGVVLDIYGYALNRPPIGSDMFDAMDSSDSLYHLSRMMSNGSDISEIDSIKFGDGQLDVTDVYVTYRRSLDPSLAWIARYWSNGVLNAEQVTNHFRGSANRLAEDFSNRQPALPAESQTVVNSTDPPAVFFSAQDVAAQAGQKIQVPVKAKISGPYPIRMLMLQLRVQPLDGAPPLTQKITFTPAPGLGQPTFNTPVGDSSYAAIWLNGFTAGLWGDTELGTLEVVIPDTASSLATYRVEFVHLSASPNGLGLFPQQVQNGLLTLGNRSGSSWSDGIPDAWRLRFFGTLSNLLSHATADADGDGVCNWAEFVAGTSPVDIKSKLQVWASRLRKGELGTPAPSIVLKWPSALGKKYVLEASSDVDGTDWRVIASDLVGTGLEMQYTDQNSAGEIRFYRVKIIE
jgi:hypothetical protein